MLFLIPLIYSYSPPPPPPPPCQIQTAGCYDGEEFRQTGGSLSPEDFNYYLGQSACIGGGCTCSSAGFVDDLKQEDADESSGACSCISGTSWTDSIGCCGDDKIDCGIIADESRFGQVINRHLCSMNENFVGTWLPSEGNIGLINYIGCSSIEKEYLSTGDDWLECTSFRIIDNEQAGGHEYICNGNPGRNSWIECCGTGSCNSRTDGVRLSSGGSVVIGQTTYYCASDNTFTIDLDTKDRISCNNARDQDGTSLGFTWTGSLCCSETDLADAKEYYNDPGGNGGCWNKEYIDSGSRETTGLENVGNLNGVFHGCNVQDSQILDIQDSHTRQPLVQNVEHCFQDPAKILFCSFNNKWNFSFGKDRSHLSIVPVEVNPDPEQPSECCAVDSCWNGQECIPNQRNNPAAPAINDRRCIDGSWEITTVKLTPDGRTGFCPDQNKCLINPSASTGNRCVSEGFFTQDDYCENGDWSTRTKFVALQLIDTAKASDYVLFCDTPKNTLNNLDQLIGGTLAENIVSTENTNNFCVLLFSNRVLIATSLNKPIAESTSFLKSVGIGNCNAALTDDGQYHSCSGQSQALGWYNLRLNSLIYSKQAFQIGPTDFLVNFKKFLRKPFNTIIDSIRNLITKPFDTSFIDGLRKFDKLYLSKTGDKEIRGIIEGLNTKNLLIQYKNFDTDVCVFIDEFNEKNKDEFSGIQCRKEGNTYYVLAQGSQITNFNPGKIWTDLTSKLRIN